MRALALTALSGLDNVAIVDVPEVAPGPGEVTVRVEAAALNHLDLWTVSGALGIEYELPHVLGADGAGVIDATGAGVEGLKPGMRVVINPGLSCGRCEFCRAGEQSECTTFRMLGEHVQGTFADLVAVPAENVFPYPDHLSQVEAAALGVTFITAYRMLFTRARMVPGEWVLVTGIGGGLALSLFQLARPLAGRLYVTSSSDDKLKTALEMGADAGINYRNDDVGKEIRRLTSKRGVDLAADSAGGPALDGALRALRKGGRVVMAGATAGPRADLDVRRLFWNQLSVIGSTMGSIADVSDMLRMVGGLGLKPTIDRVVPFDEGPAALRHLESQERFGKIVLDLTGN
ncbi:MAG: alcohol dehydrogenase catalytic domain-containing protein [Actinomycetota bacterium]